MYGKIFEQIYEGSLRLNWRALVTFQQMIILCNKDGILDMSHEALHFRTGIPLEIIKKGIEILENPDPESRTRKLEGRRIIRLSEHRSWGWQLVNHNYYRDLLSRKDKMERDRKRMAKKRKSEKRNKSRMFPNSRNESPNVQEVAHTYTDTDTYTNTDSKYIYIPKNYSLDEKMKTYALERGIDPGKVDELFLTFKDYHTEKKNKMIQWYKAWYTWVRNAPDFSRWAMKKPGPKRVSSKTENNIKVLQGG